MILLACDGHVHSLKSLCPQSQASLESYSYQPESYSLLASWEDGFSSSKHETKQMQTPWMEAGA